MQIDESVVKGINKGDEKAFAGLYDTYFTYLCMCATKYIFNPDEAQEIVNDVFLQVWYKRGVLTFPIHAYLLRSVQNGCLNYLRSRRVRDQVVDEYRKELLEYQEEFCRNDNNPMQVLEFEDLQRQLEAAVNDLPDKCRVIFEKYLYSGKSPAEIAEELGISVNTVRVQIKNALDKIKLKLGPLAGILLFYLFKH